MKELMLEAPSFATQLKEAAPGNLEFWVAISAEGEEPDLGVLELRVLPLET